MPCQLSWAAASGIWGRTRRPETDAPRARESYRGRSGDGSCRAEAVVPPHRPQRHGEPPNALVELLRVASRIVLDGTALVTQRVVQFSERRSRFDVTLLGKEQRAVEAFGTPGMATQPFAINSRNRIVFVISR